MLKKEILETIKPSMSVNYRIDPGFIKPGTNDVKKGFNFPDTFFGAEITQQFPIIKANGKWGVETSRIHCFVGKEITMEDASNNAVRYGIEDIDKLKKKYNSTLGSKLVLISKNAIPKGVELKKQVGMVGQNGIVCDTQKELESTIKELAETYLDLNISVDIKK